VIGFVIPWAIYALVVGLQLVVPARTVTGYVRDDAGERLTYRLNGLRVFAVVVALWVAVGELGWLPWDFLWLHRFESLAGAVVLGVLFTLAIVLTAPPVPGQRLPAALFLGRLWNPQYLGHRIDAKMSLYLIGAIMLGLHVLAFAAHQRLAFAGDPSPGVVLYAAMFLFFASEYLFFEEVHLYTYDFVAERVGFKLGWGCIAFYPYFYCVGLWSEAGQANPHAPLWSQILAAVVFVAGWATSRGANLQKFRFKTRPTESFLGIAPEVVSDGERALLCSGFWARSRHINYLGEIGMAVGLTLALGRPLDPWPWLYPVYYIALLVPRQLDDDRRCAAKYGALWSTYCVRVRYRIIPYVY
jgi:delta14-sterol reductase